MEVEDKHQHVSTVEHQHLVIIMLQADVVLQQTKKKRGGGNGDLLCLVCSTLFPLFWSSPERMGDTAAHVSIFQCYRVQCHQHSDNYNI